MVWKQSQIACYNQMTPKRKLRKFLEKFLSVNIMRLIGFLYGLILPAKKSYSSAGEDLIILQYFKDKKIDQGIYIDIGCFHPIWASNTYKLHKLGWSGYCFDIDEFKLKMMSVFRGSRIKTFFQAVVPSQDISDGKNSISVYKFLTPWSDLDTCDPIVAENYASKYKLDYTVSNVPAKDINSILKNLPSIDFFKIDIEGLDEAILMDMNFDLYSPEVILFENVETWSGTKEINEKLEIYGYQQLFVSGFSVCYAKPILRE